MPVNVVVCVKQVPHPEHLNRISLDAGTGRINREGVPAVINPGDRHALEEALRIRERLSGTVTVLTMGPSQSRKALEEALAMGPDAAVHLCDPAFGGADTLATARALACAIGKLAPFSLVLCGDATVDSGTGQVPVQIAEFLHLPCVTEVTEIAFEDEQSLLVKRDWEGGWAKIRCRLPAVIAVTAKINQPRLPTVMDIIAATGKEIKNWTAADIGADASGVGLCGSPTRFFEICEFHARRQGDVLKGTAEETVTRAIARLVDMEAL